MRTALATRDVIAGRRLKLLLAAVGVIAVGVPLAMLGAWLGWQSAPPLPTEEQAREVTGELLPGARIAQVVRIPKLFYYEHEGAPDSNPVVRLLIGDDDYHLGSTEVQLAAPLPPTAETQERLRAAGWKVLATSGPDGLVGAKDGLLLYVLPASDFASRPAPTLEIVRDEPVLAPALSITGLLVGGLLGSLLTRRIHRRTETTTPEVRQLVNVGAVVSIVLLIPNTLAVLTTPVETYLFASPGESAYPAWGFYTFVGVRGATHLGWMIQAVILAVVLLDFLRRPGAVDGGRDRPTTTGAPQPSRPTQH
ncbi:hypothetical protein CA850_26300 [Micromonospora echinospora]|uniref:Uncharacterized protein n=1 Tax=Micromonospora echinospora TaxID=1877 RepID=A0A1C4VLQ2_MICEC|nr:hypothetical protein [Micromonospora echinospora]OZV76732.1 hypothetical protein CA850_26300 [Micromonospora echinospora]SCE84883.1 hypothetical protein GA0070618_1370 [Micromonospora echinospora]